MIAPRKKKLIKLIIMAWSVVLVITGSALPVFASPATDECGNFLPDSFTAYWVIYRLSDESYHEVYVTSQVTKSGLEFTFPTNLTGVNYIILSLRADTEFTIQNIYVSGSITYYSDSYENGVTYCNFRTGYCAFRTWNSTEGYSHFSYCYDNPFSFSFDDDIRVASRLNFDFPVNEVSGYFVVRFDSIIINSSDVKSSIYVSNLEDSTEDLDDSVEALETALPLPTFDASAFASAEAIADDYTFFNDGLRFSFMESDLVTHIFILVVYFTCLSIAIFGHAGG